MKYNLWAEIEINIEFSDSDWAFLLECFAHHYDGYIKSCVEQGGFMYGRNNRRIFSNGENKYCELTFRQLDSVLKAIEFNPSEQADRLNSELWKIVHDVRATSEEVNKNLIERYATSKL